MAARRTKVDGLTGEDVQRLRDQLAEGGRPRVHLSGPQFADATTGTVTRVGDPAIDGTDYLTVRVKVNGVLDELAFAPAELSLRRAPARAGRQAASTPAGKAPGSKAPAGKAPGSSATARKATAGSRPPATMPATAPQLPAGPGNATAGLPDKPAAPPDRPASASDQSSPSSSASGVARRRKPAAAPKVSFTVASSGASWTVSATRGAKGIVKNVTVQPGVVTALADLLDQPALLDAVAEINETALSEAQARAEQLRAELDQLEAVLATHRAPGNQARR